jgi:hypothetical protein
MYLKILYMRDKSRIKLRIDRTDIFFLRDGPMRDLNRSKDGVR